MSFSRKYLNKRKVGGKMKKELNINMNPPAIICGCFIIISINNKNTPGLIFTGALKNE